MVNPSTGVVTSQTRSPTCGRPTRVEYEGFKKEEARP
jgi:hypothetical protein